MRTVRSALLEVLFLMLFRLVFVALLVVFVLAASDWLKAYVIYPA